MFCKCFNHSGNWAPSRLRFFVERLTSSQPIGNFRYFEMEIQNTIKPPLSCLLLSPPQSLLLLTINLDTLFYYFACRTWLWGRGTTARNPIGLSGFKYPSTYLTNHSKELRFIRSWFSWYYFSHVQTIYWFTDRLFFLFVTAVWSSRLYQVDDLEWQEQLKNSAFGWLLDELQWFRLATLWKTHCVHWSITFFYQCVFLH